MEVACPVLPSQHTEFHADGSVARHHRLPLHESTGNVQAHDSSANSSSILAYCSPASAPSHSSSPASAASVPSSTLPLLPSSLPSAPILPTQSLDTSQQHSNYTYHSQPVQPSFYGGALVKPLPSQPYPQPPQVYPSQQLLSRRQASRHGSLVMGSSLPSTNLLGAGLGLGAANANVNPIYLSPQFQAYRKKQAEKDDKAEQIWPDVLEDAFLDALLLIPQMGRKKYAMRGQLHGRNMLISEYLWVAYCLSLPPGVKPDRKMARGRKQVSSHIQVLKNFFIHHRCYHFFFPSKEKKEDTRKDLLEKESFKDNLVLRALFDGRLPDERPNYEYFGQLLASDALVAIRPSLCWILVSSAAVRYESDGPRRGEAFKPDGFPLDGRLYPHLHLNSKREEWPERGKIIRGTLLQEYTRALSQKEASSVRDISQDWEERFPGPMCSALDQIVRDDLRDILHFHVTLDVQEPGSFPEGSELNSLVEVTIEQPYLQNHRWKSVTRLARPAELVPVRPEDEESGAASKNTDPVTVSVITREIGNQYVHRPGCHGMLANGAGGSCDCFPNASRMRRQQLAVPFPAPEWATMLSMLTSHRKHPLDEDAGLGEVPLPAGGAYGARPSTKKSNRSSSGKRSSYGSTTTTSTSTRRRESDGYTHDEEAVGDESFTSTSSGASSHTSQGAPTQMDLVRDIAMLQELWSCGPSSPSSVTSPAPSPAADGSSEPTWVRRAVILWTFETVYSINERKMEVVKTPAGTGWRFLTTIDPASEYHQQQALVTPAGKSLYMQQQQQQPRAHQPRHYQSHHQHRQVPSPPPHPSYSMAAYQPQAPRRDVMSPHPGYQQHLTAAMSEHLSNAWDPNMAAAAAAAVATYRQPPSLSPPQSSYQVPPAMNLLDSTFGAGLATPPPTAGLPPLPYSYERYEQQPQQQQPQQQQPHRGHNPYGQQQGYASQLSFLSTSSASDADSGVAVTTAGTTHTQSVIDPFLAVPGSSGNGGSNSNNGELSDWDPQDMTSALDGWPVTTGPAGTGSTGTTTGAGSWQPQQLQQLQLPPPPSRKRGRSDSMDGGYPVATMPKLSHNGFSSWR